MPHANANAMYDHVTALISTGLSQRQACAAAGVALATYSDWKKKLNTHGTMDDQRRHKSGRRPALSLSEPEKNQLRALNLAKGSVAMAIEFFVTDPACEAATREYILDRLDQAARDRKPARWPDSLMAAAYVTPEERAAWFGDKATQHASPSIRHKNTMILADGTEIPIYPHAAWLFDDYSTNQPYSLDTGPAQRLCRQMLVGMDLATRSWLSVDAIGKERDQYTSGDCLRVILRTIEAMGTVPDVLILEQGRWRGNALRGLELPNGSRWGSIEDCGLVLDYGYSSRHKAEIESGFNLLQSALSETSADIGRVRGRNERETKTWSAVQQQSARTAETTRHTPAGHGYATQAQAVDTHLAAFGYLNSRPKNRKDLSEFVSADELQERWVGQRPLKPLKPEHRWLFYPIKREATVRKGAITLVTPENPQGYVFRVNGATGIYLGDGHKVLVAFDPLSLDLGCVIANLESGPRNRDEFRLGQYLTTAPYEAPIARIDLRTPQPGQRSDSWEHRTAAQRAVRTSFAAILPHGKRGLRESTAITRTGQTALARSGGPAPLQPAELPQPLPPEPQDAGFDAREGLAEAPRRSRDVTPPSASPRLPAPNVAPVAPTRLPVACEALDEELETNLW